MEAFAIILIVLVFAVTIIYVIVSHIKKSERQKYYAAAGNIIREEFLNYALQNTISPDSNVSCPKSEKIMIYLKSKSSGKKARFVFDPEKTVNIGRDNSLSNIFINDISVSQNHCRVYSIGNRVFLQDMCSSNGTFVKRGFFKNYSLFDGSQIELKTKDKITVGSGVFEVCLFYYDLNTM